MIGIDETIIRKLIHHKVSSVENKSIISQTPFDYNDDEEQVLRRMLLKPFTNGSETFEFYHPVDLKYNVLFNLSKKIRSEDDFISVSKDIAHHLISTSKHPNIKDGDLFITTLEDIKMGNKYIDGVGIYKFEEKESFLEISIKNNSLSRQFKKGIGNKKPDKACLILFTEEPYTILIIDNNTKETDYWQNDFIHQRAKSDNVNNTNDFLSITKNYITSQIQSDFDISKPEQINLLNRSVDYFKKHETFNRQQFEDEVLVDKSIIEAFNKFDNQFCQENEIKILNNFEISNQVVKKQARSFKSVLKLDKNFHIYIHGNQDLIEQGVDEKGRKYYKIYYQNEV